MGKPARSLEFEDEDLKAIQSLNLITMKPVLYLCNVDEGSLEKDNEYVSKVAELSKSEGSEFIKISGQLESEIASLETDVEKNEFLEAAGLEHSGLETLTTRAYEMLGFKTYFTAGEKEVRAWTFKSGAKAPEAAGVIHSDFERGFIRAEVYHCEDLFYLGSEAKVRENGKLRLEGKDYVVKDGDVIHFRFNV